jgi:UDP-2,4-diacetamido-2,4,6-trideoxy-beta-L-altropyranose hydrolase
MSGPSILFVADAGPGVGGGHVMRSLTLAQALASEGADCRFAAGPDAVALIAAFAPDTPIVRVASAAPQDLTQAVAGERFDAVVFDHYGLSASDHSAMAKGRPALAIDDLADRALSADLVLDSGPTRRAQDYDGLVPETARLLLGPQYAPVRPAFAALREAALARRDGGPIARILVSLGLTDVGGITGRLADKLRPKAGAAGIDLVLGAQAPSLAGLQRVARHDGRLSLHVDSPDMARLAAEADIAVGAAGSSAWERCVVGLPSLMVVLADNQRGAATALADAEAALIIDAAAPDFDDQFDRQLARLLRDAELRVRLAAASAAICDGLGAARVAEAFLKLIAARR